MYICTRLVMWSEQQCIFSEHLLNRVLKRIIFIVYTFMIHLKTIPCIFIHYSRVYAIFYFSTFVLM